jgi:predicted DNA binding CopG/RHH family protein
MQNSEKHEEGKMYGTAKECADKRLRRITVALSEEDYETVINIADAKGISNSEVINLLIKTPIRQIEKQELLIAQSPKAVAFDLITKG